MATKKIVKKIIKNSKNKSTIQNKKEIDSKNKITVQKNKKKVSSKIINYLKNTSFIQSFKFDKNIFNVILVDIILVAILFVFASIFSRILVPALTLLIKFREKFDNSIPSIENMVGPNLDVMGTTFFKVKIFIVLAVVVLLIIFSIGKFILWSVMTKQKYYKSIKMFGKYLLISLTTYLGLFVFAYLVKLIVNPNFYAPIFVFLIIPVIFFAINNMNVIFTFEKKYKDTFKILGKSFKIFYKFIIPYILIVIIFLLAITIIGLFKFLPVQVYFVILGFAALFYMAWIRNYLLLIITKTFYLKKSEDIKK